jgi:hypothetical protein
MPPTRDPAEHLRHAFVRDGRLTSLPSRRPMILAACAFLADRFERSRRYTEREVNALLAGDAPDHATLRRLLVDEGFLARDRVAYWRTATGPATRSADHRDDGQAGT